MKDQHTIGPLLVAIAIAVMTSTVYGFPSGAPLDACLLEEPQHGVPKQESVANFTFTVSQGVVAPGERLIGK